LSVPGIAQLARRVRALRVLANAFGDRELFCELASPHFLISDLALTHMGLGDRAAALARAERAMAANPIEKDPLAGPFRNLLDVEFVERGAEVYVKA
jgi:hypothetical protein